jgi:hypothetical protein
MRDKPDNISENPASNPDRKWEDTAEVRMQLHLTTKIIPKDRLDFLKSLTDGAWHDMDSRQAPIAIFFNKMSEASDYVDIVEIRDHRCALVTAAREILRKVLSDDYRGEHIPTGR